MRGEFLSIDTIKKIKNLKEDNKRYEQIICDYDKEVMRLFNIIKNAYDIVDTKIFDSFEHYKELKSVLGTAFCKEAEVNNAKTISQ